MSFFDIWPLIVAFPELEYNPENKYYNKRLRSSLCQKLYDIYTKLHNPNYFRFISDKKSKITVS